MAIGNNLVLVGPSGCGKTIIADHFARAYGLTAFKLDDYYIHHDPIYIVGKDGEPYRTYERPFMYDGDKMMMDVHKDCMAKMMSPGTWYTVIEGFVALHYKAVRQFPAIKVYLDIPFDLSVERRKTRNRGDLSDLSYEMSGEQEYKEFILPQKHMDDVHVLDGTKPINELLVEIAKLIIVV